MDCRLDHPELRFADADGRALPPLEARVAVKVLPRFPDTRRSEISSAKASTFVDALALENADHGAVFKADPKAAADRVPAPFSAYLDRRESVLPPDLLLRGGLDVNGATPYNELGKAAVIADMFARCHPALDHVYYLAYEKAPRNVLVFPCSLRQVFATPYVFAIIRRCLFCRCN